MKGEKNEREENNYTRIRLSKIYMQIHTKTSIPKKPQLKTAQQPLS